MGRIFLTGDCHGEFEKLKKKRFFVQKSLTKEDYVIILGDFGGVWDYRGETGEERNSLDWLEARPFTTLFVDGNHECFPRLEAYEEAEFCGGRVHVVRPSVLHLMRGEIFTLCGKKFFAFGGASSHDMPDGLLDPEKDAREIRRLRRLQRELYLNIRFRVIGRTWWERELPSAAELANGVDHLEANDWRVDYVLSHCAPQSIVDQMRIEGYEPDCLTRYFDTLLANGLQFRRWYFGHYNEDAARLWPDGYRCLDEEIIELRA